jgi:hypothetical protein
MPKRNSELSGGRGLRPDDAVRLEIGEKRGFTWLVRLALLFV